MNEIIKVSFEKYVEPSKVKNSPSPIKHSCFQLPHLKIEDDIEVRKHREESASHLAEALYAYNNITSVLRKESQEDNSDSNSYFELIVGFLFDIYEDLDRKDNNMSKFGDEQMGRYLELRNFIKMHVFDDFMMLYIARVGAKHLVDVIYDIILVLRNKTKRSEIERFWRRSDQNPR